MCDGWVAPVPPGTRSWEMCDGWVAPVPPGTRSSRRLRASALPFTNGPGCGIHGEQVRFELLRQEGELAVFLRQALLGEATPGQQVTPAQLFDQSSGRKRRPNRPKSKGKSGVARCFNLAPGKLRAGLAALAGPGFHPGHVPASR